MWPGGEVAESGHCCVCSWLEHGAFPDVSSQTQVSCSEVVKKNLECN